MKRFTNNSIYGWAISLCALGIFAASANVVFADGVIRDGLGAISTGRGGTNIAHSDNGEILLDNPAAMVNMEGAGLFELSADTLLTDLHYSDPQNNVDANLNPVPLGQMSVLAKSPDGHWAAGLGVFVPAGFGATWEMNGPPALPGPRVYKSLGVMGKILPGVAVRLTDRLSIGGTLGVAVSHAELEGPFFLQTGPLAGTPTVLDLQGTGAAIAWSLGLQWELSERTTLGLAFQNETRFQLDGSAVVSVFGLGHSRFDATTDLVWPRSLGLGIKHDICACRRLSVDVIWYDWSHAFDRVDLELSNPTNPLFAALLGPTVRDQFPLDWRDSISVRTGYEQFLNSGYVLRTGYAFHPNQIPESTLTPYIPAILEHAFSIGLGRRVGKCSFDVAYQYSFGPPREVTVSNVVGGDFDSSRVEAQAHWLALSFLRRF